ncbi:MAG TPA: LytTR family DNA-binding domain-containing protein, partial [Gemmatimonadaceae bacterium]|nr:LytTR family DNA-binding domain-containing protein [Gemmatimonadaceae bacterium]
MSEVKVLLVDDEPLARSSVRRLLEPHAEIAIVAECEDGWDAVEVLRHASVDLVFLDVQMPELDGFGVVREIGPARMPTTVFVTAFDEFAVRAFDVQALDYLVKPFTDERFETTLARAKQHLQQKGMIELGARLAGLLEQTGRGSVQRSEPYAKRLLVTTGNRSLVVHTATIDWIRADDYYAALHVGSRAYLLRETMAALESRLDPGVFLRVHRSVIVNLDRVQLLERAADGQLTVVLADGTKLPVSRSRRESVEGALGSRNKSA